MNRLDFLHYAAERTAPIFIYEEEPERRIVDGGSCVFLRVQSRFFALTAHHVIAPSDEAPGPVVIGIGHARDRRLGDYPSASTLTGIEFTVARADSPELDAALFEVVPKDEEAVIHLARMAITPDRILIPPEDSDDGFWEKSEVLVAGYPREMFVDFAGHRERGIWLQIAQIAGTLGTPLPPRAETLSLHPRIRALALSERNTVPIIDGVGLPPQEDGSLLRNLSGVSGGGVWVNEEDGEPFLIGIHASSSREATSIGGDDWRFAFSIPAEAFVMMLGDRVPELRAELHVTKARLRWNER